jgi:hypothetical protein
LKKKSVQTIRAQQTKDKSHRGASQYRADHSRSHDPDDIRSLRTHRHSNSNLAATLHNGMVQYTVKAYTGE